MSLENALERWEGWELGDPFDAGTLDVILEAARMWLNPNIEAAQLVKIGDPCDMDGKRDQANEWVTPRDIAAIVAAALTPGDTDV